MDNPNVNGFSPSYFPWTSKYEKVFLLSSFKYKVDNKMNLIVYYDDRF